MEELLKEILCELKWHTRQNEKIMELLGRQKKPCGQKSAARMIKLLDSMASQAKINPMLSALINEMKEVAKDGD